MGFDPCGECGLGECAGCMVHNLRAERDKLAREVKEWKHNHGQEVARARFLKKRLDMPVERVKAYDLMAEMQSKVQLFEKQIKEYRHKDLHFYVLRSAVYALARKIDIFELEENELDRISKELILVSGVCRCCGGTGEDGDPDGGTYACDICNGQGYESFTESELIALLDEYR